MAYNKDGLKYFIYCLTKNKNPYLELPEEIRKIIWKYAHYYPYVNCYICDKGLISLNVNYINRLQPKKFSIINGLTKCNEC